MLARPLSSVVCHLSILELGLPQLKTNTRWAERVLVARKERRAMRRKVHVISVIHYDEPPYGYITGFLTNFENDPDSRLAGAFSSVKRVPGYHSTHNGVVC
jgi:hypothetical protein